MLSTAPQDGEHIVSCSSLSLDAVQEAAPTLLSLLSASWLQWGIRESKGHRFSSKGANLLSSKETSIPSDKPMTLAKQLQNLFP